MNLNQEYSSIIIDSEKEINRLDEIIADVAEKVDNQETKFILQQIVNSGGKRVRPLLMIMCAKLIKENYQSERICNLAAAVELLHTATLLHDDVIDEAKMRRGKRTVSEGWNNPISILSGDYLLSQAFIKIVEDGNAQIMKEIAESSAIIASGEMEQLQNKGKFNITIPEYLKTISNKTAQLFAASSRISALSAGLDDEMCQEFFDFGYNIGISFQLIDDYIDYFSNSSDSGKSVGIDLYERKVTLPVILLRERLSGTNKKDIIQKMFSEYSAPYELDSDQHFREFKGVVEEMKLLCIDSDIRDFTECYTNAALSNLENITKKLKGSCSRTAQELEKLIKFIQKRSF